MCALLLPVLTADALVCEFHRALNVNNVIGYVIGLASGSGQEFWWFGQVRVGSSNISTGLSRVGHAFLGPISSLDEVDSADDAVAERQSNRQRTAQN